MCVKKEGLWNHLPSEELLKQLGCHVERGLDSAEAESSPGQFGPNRLTSKKAKGSIQRFLVQFHQPRLIPSEELMPGDIVTPQSGDKVPAGMRLLRVRDLKIDESALTVESVAVEKAVGILDGDMVLADRGGRCRGKNRHRQWFFRDFMFLPSQLPLSPSLLSPGGTSLQQADHRRHRVHGYPATAFHISAPDEPPFPHGAHRLRFVAAHYGRGADLPLGGEF